MEKTERRQRAVKTGRTTDTRPAPDNGTRTTRLGIRIRADGTAERGYAGVDMAEVYRSKPLYYKVVKRAFDILASAILLILLSPLFLIIAIAIRLDDGGKAIYSGKRWGREFRYFPMYKFRTMHENAENRTNEVISEEDRNGMAFKIKDDPRITRVGKFLRKTSLDELPQLVNVLLGQMSMVGPRPIQTTTEDGDPYDMQRWCVKPGLTCYWQTSGRDLIPWDEWVEMDLKYIQDMSICTDLKLLLKTIPSVIGGKGAE